VKYWRWLAAVWRWLMVPSTEWLGLLVVAGGVTVAAFLGGDEGTIRVVGMLLQLLGIATVAKGIVDTRRLFGRPSIRIAIAEWLSAFPPMTPKHAVIAVSDAMHLSISASGFASASLPADASIQTRVEVLETNVRLVHERITGVQAEIDATLKTLHADLHDEKSTRSAEDEALSVRLENASTGGLRISAVGALWLSVGVVMSTIPAELSALALR